MVKPWVMTKIAMGRDKFYCSEISIRKMSRDNLTLSFDKQIIFGHIQSKLDKVTPNKESDKKLYQKREVREF
jgi:hypothetical protein